MKKRKALTINSDDLKLTHVKGEDKVDMKKK